VDNLDPYYDINLKKRNITIFENNPNYLFVKGDIRDQKLMSNLIKDVDAIFHLAAQPGVRTSVKNPRKTFEINVAGTFNLLEACLDSDVRKIIFSSSSSVYGRAKYLPIDEKHPTNPISPYAVSKLSAEYYCKVFYEIYGLKTVILRYFTVYGPRMRPDLAISIFTANALKNEPIKIFGDGSQTRDFVYVNDVVELSVKCLNSSNVNGEVINVGSGKRISILELARKIIDLVNSKSKIVFMDKRREDVEHTWADISKAKKLLNYTPKYDLDRGLKLYVNWVMSNEKFR